MKWTMLLAFVAMACCKFYEALRGARIRPQYRSAKRCQEAMFTSKRFLPPKEGEKNALLNEQEKRAEIERFYILAHAAVPKKLESDGYTSCLTRSIVAQR